MIENVQSRFHDYKYSDFFSVTFISNTPTILNTLISRHMIQSEFDHFEAFSFQVLE